MVRVTVASVTALLMASAAVAAPAKTSGDPNLYLEQVDGADVPAGHGAHHLDLAELTSAEQRAEIGDCLDTVERHVGARPATYAYASGRYDARALALLHELGVAAAVTEIPGVVGAQTDPLQWPRERMNRETPVASFIAYAQLARGGAAQTSRALR